MYHQWADSLTPHPMHPAIKNMIPMYLHEYIYHKCTLLITLDPLSPLLFSSVSLCGGEGCSVVTSSAGCAPLPGWATMIDSEKGFPEKRHAEITDWYLTTMHIHTVQPSACLRSIVLVLASISSLPEKEECWRLHTHSQTWQHHKFGL